MHTLSILVDIHSFVRWMFLILAAIVLVDSILGIIKRRAYTGTDNLLSLMLVSLADLQLVFGLILYFTGDYGYKLLQNYPMAEVMSNTVMRFFTMEHSFGMLLAIILLHMSRVIVKRENNNKRKFRKQLIWLIIVLILMVAFIPWPAREIFSSRGWI